MLNQARFHLIMVSVDVLSPHTKGLRTAADDDSLHARNRKFQRPLESLKRNPVFKSTCKFLRYSLKYVGSDVKIEDANIAEARRFGRRELFT